jgi:hypothetical protein
VIHPRIAATSPAMHRTRLDLYRCFRLRHCRPRSTGATRDGGRHGVRGRQGQRSDRARQVHLAGTSRGSTCYYARLRSNDGEVSDII